MKRMMVFGILAGFLLLGTSKVEARPYSRMSCYELWYARNAIFAKEGYCFTTRQAINTFGRRCYPPYGRLTRWEADEVDRIKYWERRKGCSGGYVPPAPAPSYGNYGSGYAQVVGIRPGGFLAVRTGPGTGYAQIGSLYPGDSGIRVLRCMGRWCRIRYGNLIGWVYSGYLRFY
ncbi:YARHG domain-containing protein [Nitratifractor sp.]